MTECALTLPALSVDDALVWVGAAASVFATVWGARFIVRSISKGR